jgi:AsmA protein
LQTGKRISAASGKSPHVRQLHSHTPGFNQNDETGAGVSDLKFSFAQWPMRRIVIGGVIASLFVVLVIAASLPFAVSSGLVRDRLERDIGAWAGHTVSLGDAPSLDFWPTPTITLDKVVIHPSTFSGGDPILRADRIVANFNLFSAVLGAPSFSEFRLIRPTFNVELYPDATSNWSSASGELSQRHSEAAAIRYQAEQTGEEVCPQKRLFPLRPHLAPSPSRTAPSNGCGIRVQRPKSSQRSTGRGLDGATAVARANITAIFRGEQVTLAGSTAAPLLLLGGRTAPVEATISSAPLNIEFGGSASLGQNYFLSGALTLSSVSVRRALEWSGTDIRPGEALGALELTAKVTAEQTQGQARRPDHHHRPQPRYRRSGHGAARRCAAADRRHSGVQLA